MPVVPNAVGWLSSGSTAVPARSSTSSPQGASTPSSGPSTSGCSRRSPNPGRPPTSLTISTPIPRTAVRFVDLTYRLTLGSHTYPAEEVTGWLEEAGFADARVKLAVQRRDVRARTAAVTGRPPEEFTPPSETLHSK